MEHLIGPGTVLCAKISKSGSHPGGVFNLLGVKIEIFKRMINAKIEIYTQRAERAQGSCT